MVVTTAYNLKRHEASHSTSVNFAFQNGVIDETLQLYIVRQMNRSHDSKVVVYLLNMTCTGTECLNYLNSGQRIICGHICSVSWTWRKKRFADCYYWISGQRYWSAGSRPMEIFDPIRFWVLTTSMDSRSSLKSRTWSWWRSMPQPRWLMTLSPASLTMLTAYQLTLHL